MTIRIHSDGSGISFRVRVEGARVFIDTAESEVRSLCVETPLDIDPSFEGKSFSIHYLTSPSVRENDVKQFYCRKTMRRVGWLIPALSLVSNLHDFSKNIHFLRYAYIAVRDAFVVAPDSVFSRHVDISEKDSISITDVFCESTVFLVISEETLVEGCSFDMQRALPSLVRNGYVALSSRDPETVKFDVADSEEDKVYFDLISNQIEDPSIVSWLLESYSTSYRDPVLQFFYLYQIIEFLMELVLGFEHQAVASELLAAGPDSSKIKIAIEKVNDSVSEKKRMHLLAERYCEAESDLNELKSAGNFLLSQLGLDTGSTLATVLYPIRNFVFHRYRSFPSASMPALKSVVDELLVALPLMLARFKADSNP